MIGNRSKSPEIDESVMKLGNLIIAEYESMTSAGGRGGNGIDGPQSSPTTASSPAHSSHLPTVRPQQVIASREGGDAASLDPNSSPLLAPPPVAPSIRLNYAVEHIPSGDIVYSSSRKKVKRIRNKYKQRWYNFIAILYITIFANYHHNIYPPHNLPTIIILLSSHHTTCNYYHNKLTQLNTLGGTKDSSSDSKSVSSLESISISSVSTNHSDAYVSCDEQPSTSDPRPSRPSVHDTSPLARDVTRSRTSSISRHQQIAQRTHTTTAQCALNVTDINNDDPSTSLLTSADITANTTDNSIIAQVNLSEDIPLCSSNVTDTLSKSQKTPQLDSLTNQLAWDNTDVDNSNDRGFKMADYAASTSTISTTTTSESMSYATPNRSPSPTSISTSHQNDCANDTLNKVPEQSHTCIFDGATESQENLEDLSGDEKEHSANERESSPANATLHEYNIHSSDEVRSENTKYEESSSIAAPSADHILVPRYIAESMMRRTPDDDSFSGERDESPAAPMIPDESSSGERDESPSSPKIRGESLSGEYHREISRGGYFGDIDNVQSGKTNSNHCENASSNNSEEKSNASFSKIIHISDPTAGTSTHTIVGRTTDEILAKENCSANVINAKEARFAEVRSRGEHSDPSNVLSSNSSICEDFYSRYADTSINTLNYACGRHETMHVKRSNCMGETFDTANIPGDRVKEGEYGCQKHAIKSNTCDNDGYIDKVTQDDQFTFSDISSVDCRCKGSDSIDGASMSSCLGSRTSSAHGSSNDAEICNLTISSNRDNVTLSPSTGSADNKTPGQPWRDADCWTYYQPPKSTSVATRNPNGCRGKKSRKKHKLLNICSTERLPLDFYYFYIFYIILIEL